MRQGNCPENIVDSFRKVYLPHSLPSSIYLSIIYGHNVEIRYNFEFGQVNIPSVIYAGIWYTATLYANTSCLFARPSSPSVTLIHICTYMDWMSSELRVHEVSNTCNYILFVAPPGTRDRDRQRPWHPPSPANPSGGCNYKLSKVSFWNEAWVN